MINMHRHENKNNSGIVIVDVEPEYLPEKIRDVAKNYSANVPENKMLSRIERLKHAYSLLRIYATETKVLITSRIHAALPASALGIPVIFVERKSLPGMSFRKLFCLIDSIMTIFCVIA
jgi:exopolysaccharide biosynthesis predicted pyruvyltransferase EpsI